MVFSHSSCEKEWAPTALSYTTAALSGFLGTITIPGNLLICIAMLKDPHKELRSPFNYFVVNLAMADLLVGSVAEPAFVVYHVREALKYNIMDKIWLVHIIYFTTCMASLLSLSALTIDRYLTVTSWKKRRPKGKRFLICLGMIWLVSICFPFLYFATGFYLFAFIFANSVILVTLCVVSYAYVRVYSRLRSQVVRWGSLNQKQMESRAMLYEKKLTHSFMIILSFFITCLIPNCVINYFIGFCKSCDCTVVHWLRDVQFMLTFINCSANQFLYAMRMSKFRRAFTTLLQLNSCGLFKLFSERRKGLYELNHRELVQIPPVNERSRSGISVLDEKTGARPRETGEAIESTL